MWLLLSTLALAAPPEGDTEPGAGDPPCYGLPAAQATLRGDHFWVTWAPGQITEDEAAQVLEWAELARTTYLDLGFGFSDHEVVIEVTDEFASSGFAQTQGCGVDNVPWIQVQPRDLSLNLVAHEVAHASQYADMGHYLDSVASWIWWMEGSAVWMALQVDGNVDRWARDSSNYLRYSELSLHHSVVAFAASDRSVHMYGTAWLAQYVDEHHGGPQTMRELWAWGGERSGEVIVFPDAVDAVIGDFEPFWADFLARSTIGDLAEGRSLSNRMRAERIETLPQSGEMNRPPEGYGFSAVHFVEGGTDADLVVDVEVDPEVPWTVVLVKTDGAAVGRAVLETVEIEVVDGFGSGTLPDYGPGEHAWLVASPRVMDIVARPVLWSADLVYDETPESEPTACGCRSTSLTAFWPLLVLLVRRRS